MINHEVNEPSMCIKCDRCFENSNNLLEVRPVLTIRLSIPS